MVNLLTISALWTYSKKLHLQEIVRDSYQEETVDGGTLKINS